MKVALVYDRVNKWGGAERVLLALRKIFPEAPLYTSVYDRANASWASEFEVRTSFLQRAKYLRAHNDKLFLLMPLSFESFNFDEFDLVISVTSEAAKGIITKPGTRHICYCLTPTRYLWSGYGEYIRGDLRKTLSRPAVSYLRAWDKVAASRPDQFIAISGEVRHRIEKYYGRESKLLYPPVMIGSSKKKISQGEEFLLVSRFSRGSYYKRVDLAVDAFNRSGLPLTVIGGGPMLDEVRSKAKSNIKFLGEVSEEVLIRNYESCRALIFPGLEDFGLVMAEAQTFGKPVIAYRGGGATEIVLEGQTGEFFDGQTVGSILGALKRFEGKSYNTLDIKRNSERFSFENFKSGLQTLINE
jgi:glycosyltransferase involved in cell wall biosynthesis